MRFSLNTFVLASLVGMTIGQDTSLSTVKKAFDNAAILSDLGITFNPSVLLEVSYPVPEQRPIAIRAGIELPQKSMRGVGPPNFSVVGAQCNTSFVVAVIDPDAPTPENPITSQIRHFLGGNFNCSSENNTPRSLVNATAAITEYTHPTLPTDSAAHRIIYFLFKQPAGFVSQKFVMHNTPREHFDLKAFASVTGLGDPIGGTFMLFGQNP
ncbi:hypothetical protein H0H87_000355 [Tephrocybe sp. NHM501043]|nr:hypothetical protein H0H87_000355 [Tephrocybe sp. NHM501043]